MDGAVTVGCSAVYGDLRVGPIVSGSVDKRASTGAETATWLGRTTLGVVRVAAGASDVGREQDCHQHAKADEQDDDNGAGIGVASSPWWDAAWESHGVEYQSTIAITMTPSPSVAKSKKLRSSST